MATRRDGHVSAKRLLKIKLPLANALADLRGDCHALRNSDELKNLIKELKLDKTKLVQCLSDNSMARQVIAQAPKFKEISDHLVNSVQSGFHQSFSSVPGRIGRHGFQSGGQDRSRRVA